jgi:hypothetical protein
MFRFTCQEITNKMIYVSSKKACYIYTNNYPGKKCVKSKKTDP